MQISQEAVASPFVAVMISCSERTNACAVSHETTKKIVLKASALLNLRYNLHASNAAIHTTLRLNESTIRQEFQQFCDLHLNPVVTVNANIFVQQFP
jgi:hypothetical protein